MKNILFLILTFTLFTSSLLAQNNSEISQNYRRSSLHLILMEAEAFPSKDTIMKAYFSAPFPNKYNKHSVSENSFNAYDFPVYPEDRITDSLQRTKMGKILKLAYDKASSYLIDTSEKDYPIMIKKYFEQTKMANQLVAKWFSRNEKGEFNMDLISERGFYDASALKADIASKTVRGSAILGDAGEELIKNTFVVVNRMNFVSNEKIAAFIRDEAIKSANLNLSMSKILYDAAVNNANKLYEKTKDGHSVWTTSYLYQLEWNDSISAIFYEELWVDENNPNPAKIEAFDNSDLFHLEYVGQEKATSLVLFSGEGKTTREEILKLATIRNLDNVYAKLQKEYEVFQTKTPIYSVDPITAKIGLKEGLEGNEKFEIFEQKLDEKTGRTKYISKGKITVQKDKIWDNRYNLGESTGANDENGLSETTFKGSSKSIYPGMLIKQVK